MTILRAVNIHKSVQLPSGDGLPILVGAHLVLDRGESVALLGRSGSGKSTLLSILGLLSRPDQGEVYLLGTSTKGATDRRRAQLRNQVVGFVFQNYSLIGHLTAAQNVELPILYGIGLSRKEIARRVQETLDLVGLRHRGGSYPRELSGGEQQRVAIARALVRKPTLVLADEPTGALDSTTAAQVLDALTEATKVSGVALAIVTHDDVVAASLERQLHLVDGRLEESSTP